MIYDMSLNNIRKIEYYILGKEKTTRDMLIKEGVDYQKRRNRAIIYDRDQIWEYFMKNPKMIKIFENRKIKSIEELEIAAFNSILNQNRRIEKILMTRNVDEEY